MFALRIVMGWMFLYAGMRQLLNPEFSAAGYLSGAKMLTGFYGWLASPNILPVINVVNEWALTLLGVSLILGIAVRLSAPLGALLMILYWIPLGVIYPNAHAYIVDEHVIYAAALLVLAAFRVEGRWGRGKFLE